MTPSPSFTFVPKTGGGLSEPGVSFYSVGTVISTFCTEVFAYCSLIPLASHVWLQWLFNVIPRQNFGYRFSLRLKKKRYHDDTYPQRARVGRFLNS